MTKYDALRVFIVRYAGDDRLIIRRLLLALYRGEVRPDEVADLLRYGLRCSNFVAVFQNLTVFLIATKGDLRGFREALPNSPRVAALYGPFSAWLTQCLVEGRLSLPPVNESSGMAFAGTVLDGAEAILLSLRATEEALRVSELRRMVDEAWRDHGKHWALSTAFSSHIGHFAYAATFLTLRDAGELKAPPIVMLRGESQNPYLRSMFERYMVDRLPDSVLYAELISARKRQSLAKGGSAAMSELVSRAVRLWHDRRPFLTMEPELERRGAAVLSGFGVQPDAPIVTVHVREEGYNPGLSRFMHQRDGRFETYGQAVGGLVARGFTVIRLGDRTMTPAPAMEGLIDYPFTDAKSDWMDIYLAGRCAFHIGTSSGMSFVPMLFGHPVLFTNFPTLSHLVCAPSVVSLPKVLQTEDGATIPFASFCQEHGDILEAYDAVLHNVKFQDNTPQDLADAALMMVEHLDLATGKIVFPDGLFTRARSLLPNQPQIPDWFLERHYSDGST